MTHVEEQLQAAYAGIRDLGEPALQEADALTVARLWDRIGAGKYELNQAEAASAQAEHQLEQLRGLEQR